MFVKELGPLNIGKSGLRRGDPATRTATLTGAHEIPQRTPEQLREASAAISGILPGGKSRTSRNARGRHRFGTFIK